MKSKPPKFKIGDWVSVAATVTFEYDEKNHKDISRTESQPWIGQIVGARRKQTGKYEPGWRGGYWEDDSEPASFTPERTILVWLVSKGLLNVPKMALEEDVELVPADLAPERTQWMYADYGEWDDRSRQYMREEAQKAPRDAKGRFLKYEPTHVS